MVVGSWFHGTLRSSLVKQEITIIAAAIEMFEAKETTKPNYVFVHYYFINVGYFFLLFFCL